MPAHCLQGLSLQRCTHGGLKPAAQFALAVGGGGVPWAAASSLLEMHTTPGEDLSIPPLGYPPAASPRGWHLRCTQNWSQMWKTQQLKRHIAAP